MPRIRPLPIALALTGVLGALALAKSATSQWESRVAALQHAAEAKRAQLHLSEDAACKQDSTPEVTFKDADLVHPGQRLHFTVAGTFHGTPTPVFRRDDVTVSSSKLTSAGLVVDAQVSAHALPGPAELELIRELCPRGDEVYAAHIVAKTRWDFRYPNGWAVQLTCQERNADNEIPCQAVWTGKGGPKTTQARLREAGVDNYNVDYALTDEESALFQKQMEKYRLGPSPEITAKMQKAQEEIGKCGKLPQDKQLPCLQTASVNAQKVADEFQEAMKKVTPPPGPPVIGCSTSYLEVTGSNVTASGHDCGKAGEELEGGTGTVQVQ